MRFTRKNFRLQGVRRGSRDEERKWYLITSTTMFSTLKLSGSFFTFSLSVMHNTMMKMTKYESCENTTFSTRAPRRLGSDDLSVPCGRPPLPSFTGRNDVYGGRYLTMRDRAPSISKEYGICERLEGPDWARSPVILWLYSYSRTF